jgi:hypothetical protein
MERACAALEASLREQFNAEAVALKLFPVDPEQRAATRWCTPSSTSSTATAASAARCAEAGGAPVRRRGADHPLRRAGAHPRTEQTGVLAIGSADPKRFAPDMGTELLGAPRRHRQRQAHRSGPPGRLSGPTVEPRRRLGKDDSTRDRRGIGPAGTGDPGWTPFCTT